MAIQFARIAYVSRSTGGNACRKAAYNERGRVACERTGQVFNFCSRKDLSHHEVLLPDGVSGKFKETRVLWNAAEKAERRKDSQVAKECVIALPDNPEITHSDRLEITKRYAHAMFVSQGLAAQIDIHAPHEREKNWHAHILVTTRGFTADGQALSPRKARETDPSIKKGYVQQDLSPGAVFAQIQNDYFRERGLDIRVDPTGIVPQKHIGPVRMRGYMDDALERANLLRESNEEAVRNPTEVLKKLTQNQATFTMRDLDTFLNKHVDGAEIGDIADRVWSHPDLLPLYDPHTRELTPYWTTRPVRSEEEKGMRFSERIHHDNGKVVSSDVVMHYSRLRALSPEQRRAVQFATLETEGLVVIEGRAGTGKSYTMQALREIYEQSGLRVIGLAPTNQVSADMGKDGFGESMTAHSFLFQHKNKRLSLEAQTVLIVDEAAMLGTSAMVELMKVAQDQQCKVVLFGDDRQLSSVERGGLFSILRQRYGSCSLTEVRRQTDWHKTVSELLSEGHTQKAVALLAEKSAIQWQETKEDSLSQLVQDWAVNSQISPSQERLILANKNRDVDTLNWAIRDIRVARGEVSDQGYTLQTARGLEEFSVHDRVCLTVTDKAQGLHNGSFGTITALDENHCAVILDSGQDVTFDPQTYPGLKLGYAATVYKSQGKSIPEIYVLHDPHLSARLSYVALTRHKESLKIYANTEETRDLTQLTSQMRARARDFASLRFMTSQEIEQHRRQEQGDRNILDIFRNVLKKTKDFVTDALHENEAFYDLSEKARPVPPLQTTVQKIVAEAQQGRLLTFEQWQEKYAQHFSKHDSRSHDIQVRVATKTADLMVVYQRHHERQPDGELRSALERRAVFEVQHEKRIEESCRKYHFAKKFGRTPQAYDRLILQEMAAHLQAIEGRLVQEHYLSRDDAVNVYDIARLARIEYEQSEIRESTLTQDLQKRHHLSEQIAQAAAKILQTTHNKYGASFQAIGEAQAIQMAEYKLDRLQDLMHGEQPMPTAGQRQRHNVLIQAQVSLEVEMLQKHCERYGQMPSLEQTQEIQNDASKQARNLENTMKRDRFQELRLQRENTLSRSLEV